MQRTAASLGMDWLFLTAEVPEDRLREAFQGIRALKFSGVAFLSPHQQSASLLVDSLTESALRSGHVRVARRDGDAWLGDDTLGMAIVELLSHEQAFFQPFRDSPARHEVSSGTDLKEKILVESHSQGLLCTGLDWMAHLIRLAQPDWSSLIYHWDDKREEPLRVSSDQAEIRDREATQTDVATATSDVDTAKSPSFVIFIIDSSSPPITTKQLGKLVGEEDEITAVFVHQNASWESAIQKLDVSRKHVYRSIDIAAAKAAVNFQFWTGQAPEFASIRDSLDEYCQW